MLYIYYVNILSYKVNNNLFIYYIIYKRGIKVIFKFIIVMLKYQYYIYYIIKITEYIFNNVAVLYIWIGALLA